MGVSTSAPEQPHRRHRWCGWTAPVVVLAAAAGCSDSGHPPTIALGESNAMSVAAEALITTGRASSVLQLPTGAMGVATAVASLAGPRLAAQATGADVVGGALTTPCGVSGQTTTTTSGTTVSVAFHACRDGLGPQIDGTLQYTLRPSGSESLPAALALSATFDLTFTDGALSVAESGGYDLVFQSMPNPGGSSLAFDVTGARLTIRVAVAGIEADQLAISDFDIGVTQLLTIPSQQREHFRYDIDSTRLAGRVAAVTTADLGQILDGLDAHKFPYTGQIVVHGTGGTRLQITIIGDETFVPPSDQGQVELQLDAGAGGFGPPIGVNWSALTAQANAAR